MALTKSIVFDNGIECPEAYIKIANCKMDFISNRAWITVNTYKNKAASTLKPMNEEELRVYNSTTKESIQSSFIVSINEITIESDDTFTLIFGGVAIELPANLNLALNSNYTSNLINTINNSTMSNYIIAEASIDVNEIIISAKKGSVADGQIGDSLIIEGSCVNGVIGRTYGVDAILGDFTKYFILPYANNQITNVREQGYNYMKTLSDFAGCVDVVELIV